MNSQFDNTFNQIIVIGNGFDLACNLNSGYNDFFNTVFTHDPGAKQNILTDDDQNIKNPVNIWDIIFVYAKNEYENRGISAKDTHWQDVERIIKDCISNSPDKGDKYSYFRQCYPDFIFSIMQNISPRGTAGHTTYVTPEQIAEKLNIDKPDLFDKAEEEANLLGYFDITNHKVDPQYWHYDNNAVARAYLEELYSFENEFKEYLQNEINSNYSVYTNKAKNLYFNISNLCDTYSDGKDKQDLLLSFNYTTPLLDLINAGDKEVAERLWIQKNIHGTLDTIASDGESPIIFGIDGFQSNGERDKEVNQIFSKSYRKLNLEEQPLPNYMDNPRRTLFDPISSNAEIHCIKIFGHSLGEADYSYFRLIFDSVDLIHGKTILYILYTEGHKPNPMAIYRLLDRYSDEVYRNGTVKSATRIDLLQKLLMEDRIRLRKIASPF